MGFHKKTGKGRIDKWYRLAKEKGYRARAAFKLIQLNRKYGFLEKSRVLLDLCAAPGSWCQVAAETMPAQGSIIVGVDLAPIKPIPRAITFQSDITTDRCRAIIRQHLKTWKADTVLHDGAPNVGTAWVQDAFSQAELVLQAMKLATEFLIEGGTFVTKVFRSKDYNALLWVFNQLFSKVEATKPPSSRNVSAEIFVVCRGFKAPKRIDPRFLDPKSVFAELSDPTPNNEAKVFNPERKKRRREGYEEGDYIQFQEVPADRFIQTTDPIAMLGSFNKLSFEQDGNGNIALAALDKLPETTGEIRQCCSDLKVLGRKEFRSLLRWRLKAREIFGLATKKKITEDPAGEEVSEVTPIVEELKIQEELEKLNNNETARKKRERRRDNEKKHREIIRMQLHMTTPTEIGLEQEGPKGRDTVFRLADVDRAGAVDKVVRGKMAVSVQPQMEEGDSASDEKSDDEENELDTELDALYNQYQERKSESSAKYRAKKARTEHEDGDFEGFSDREKSSDDDFEQDSDRSSETGEDSETQGGGLLFPKTNHSRGEVGLTRRAALFFEQDVFKELGGLEAIDVYDSAVDLDSPDQEKTVVGSIDRDAKEAITPPAINLQAIENVLAESSSESEQDSKAVVGDSDDEADSETESGFMVVKSHDTRWEAQDEPHKNGRLDIDIITAEAMTLAQQVASGQKTAQDLVDEGFNKFTFRDTDGLPDWFLDDENRHSKPHRPISAAAATAIKEKLRVLNARPIKKVREAKDRKKFKAAQKLETLRKKSALIAEDEGISEKDKASNIARMMSRASKKKPKQQVKVVVATGGNRGISGRPKGVKGKYKIVDARLKKDVRAEKRLAKKRR